MNKVPAGKVQGPSTESMILQMLDSLELGIPQFTNCSEGVELNMSPPAQKNIPKTVPENRNPPNTDKERVRKLNLELTCAENSRAQSTEG